MKESDSHNDAPIIEIRDLVKTFGAVRALDGFDLTVARGGIHGFLGPNGAGKSTAIRLLLGLLRPDSGRMCLLGTDPWRHGVAVHHRLAYVPGDVSLWPTLTGGEAIDVLLALRDQRHTPRRAELIDRFALDPSRRCRTYSKGNRQKVALVAALAADVDLLVLDEPTSGLDPLMEAVFQECIAEANGRGTTVLLSSHILAEVERLCDEVTIIRAGRAVRTGTLDDLRRWSRTAITARTTRPVPVTDLSHLGADEIRAGGHDIAASVEPARLGAVMSLLVAAGIESVTCQPPSLEEIFLGHYAVAEDS